MYHFHKAPDCPDKYLKTLTCSRNLLGWILLDVVCINELHLKSPFMICKKRTSFLKGCEIGPSYDQEMNSQCTAATFTIIARESFLAIEELMNLTYSWMSCGLTLPKDPESSIFDLFRDQEAPFWTFDEHRLLQ